MCHLQTQPCHAKQHNIKRVTTSQTTPDRSGPQPQAFLGAKSSCLSMLQTQAEVLTAATLTWRQWHLNYYHGLGESVFEVHSLACKWLHYCGAANSTDLVPIFIERSGDQATWAQFLPAAESALKCLFPGPNYFIGDDRIQNKVSDRSLLTGALVACS